MMYTGSSMLKRLQWSLGLTETRVKDNKYSRQRRRGRSGSHQRGLVLLIIAAGSRLRNQRFYSQLITTADNCMWAMQDLEGVSQIMS